MKCCFHHHDVITLLRRFSAACVDLKILESRLCFSAETATIPQTRWDYYHYYSIYDSALFITIIIVAPLIRFLCAHLTTLRHFSNIVSPFLVSLQAY